MVRPPPVIEAIDDEMAEILRRKSPAEKLAIASGMFAFARRLIFSMLQRDHPDWDQKRILAETARRLSHGAI